MDGRKFTSNSNGNSIFLPATGYRDFTSLYGPGGYYWSRSLDPYVGDDAVRLDLYYHGVDLYGSRYYGQSVRPVRVP